VDDADTPPKLKPAAWARIGLTLGTAMVLLVSGWSGWTASNWLIGSGAFAIITIIGKGYWRPTIVREVIRVAGGPGATGIAALLVAFNLALSALLLGTGVILGHTWQAIT
jgi:hypothetical protein